MSGTDARSRSHAIMTVHCDFPAGAGAGAADCGLARSGKVSFVDLAGSERIRDSRSTGDSQLREASNINRSLFTLGKARAPSFPRRVNLGLLCTLPQPHMLNSRMLPWLPVVAI